MTVYSQHPNRGKTQILATYNGVGGITSSTVTSLPDAALAAPLVNALNEISALATVPVSVHDRRRDDFGYYPSEHLSALVDRNARADLLEGAHSLWYELVKLRLHDAFEDLDKVMAAVPPPVQTAVAAELERESTQLRNGLAEFSDDTEFSRNSDTRYWDFNAPPFVASDAAADVLDSDVRKALERAEQEVPSGNLAKAVADLRLLAAVEAQHHVEGGTFDPAGFEIFCEPYDSDRYYVTVNAPWSRHFKENWQITIGRWVPDDPDDEEYSSATGEPLLSCSRHEAPSAAAIVALLELSEQRAEQLADWAKTSVGSTLSGTDFVVTKREA